MGSCKFDVCSVSVLDIAMCHSEFTVSLLHSRKYEHLCVCEFVVFSLVESIDRNS